MAMMAPMPPMPPMPRGLPRVAAVLLLIGVQLVAGTAGAGPKEAPRAAPSPTPGPPTAPAAAVPLTGVYEADPVPQGKRFQGTWLRVDGSGERFVLSYRPEPKYFAFIGRRVVITGRHRVLSGYEQAIRARHFDVDSIALAPGEAPLAAGSQTLPAPPLVSTKEALAALRGRWARVFGRVVTMEQSPHESRMITRLIVSMPDGYRLEIRDAYLDNLRWDKASRTDTITLIGQAHERLTDGGTVPDLAISAVCQGHIERCGMSP